MEYKRLEIYVGWTCNHRCTYCKEFSNMEIIWNKKVTKYEILKLLLKYKKKGYNHVTFLGGEPFIQEVFYDALLLGKKLGYTILVTTNATTLHIESQAKKYLPYIDELILSMQAISREKQFVISRTNVFVDWKLVFGNIKKYWNGKMLKVNTVILKDNLDILFNMVKFLNNIGISEISLTYPDIDLDYYGKKHILKSVAPTYRDTIKYVLPIIEYCENKNIRLKLPDFPFCVFPKENIEKYIKLTDDYDYQTRINIFQNDIEYDRGDLSAEYIRPRERIHNKICDKCIYRKQCWGFSKYYETLYGLDEINNFL